MSSHSIDRIHQGFTLVRTCFAWRYDKFYRSLVKPCQGFTLIELLVTISIIAILSTIAISTYINAQANARDAKRRADIDTISQALEIHYADVSCGASPGGYCPLQPSYFGSGAIPTHPNGASYCISYPGTPGGALLPDSDPTSMPLGPPDGPGNCSFTDFKAINTSAPWDPALPSIAWRVCTKLGSGTIYCRRSQR